MKAFTNPIRRLVKVAATRLWEHMQWPDIEVIHGRTGMFGVVGFLQQSYDPTLTRDVLARFGAQIHPDCGPLGPNLTMHESPDGFANLTVGARVHIGRQVFLDLTDRIVIEEGVSIGMRTIILTHLNMGEPSKPLCKLFPMKHAPTILRRGCSIGANAIIACGVEIGEDTIVNAGVLVDQDVPARTVVTTSRIKPDLRIPDRVFTRRRVQPARNRTPCEP
jgi:acetyltransferase-like isoleucine patch superfamily enzyme